MFLSGSHISSFVKRVWLSGVLVGLVGLAVAAPALAEEKPVTLEFWHIWNGARQPIMRETLNRFEQRYPGIKVKDVLVSSADRAQKIIVATAAGVPPDVAMVSLADSDDWGRSGILTALDPLARAQNVNLSKVMYPNVVKGITIDGHVYYLPHVMSIMTLLYANSDMLAMSGLDTNRLPQTLDDLETAAKKMTRRTDEKITQVGMNVFGGPGGAERAISFRLWLHLLGGSVYDSTGREVTLDTPEARRTLQWMSDFNDSVVGGAAALTSFHAGTDSLFSVNFQKGQSGLFMWQDFYYGFARGQRPDLNMVVDLPPYDPTLGRRTLLEPGWGYGVFSQSAHPKEAFLLLQWLTMEADGGGAFAESQSRPTAVPSINVRRSYYQINPYWNRLIEAFNMGTFGSRGPAVVKTDDALKKLINDAIFQPTAGISAALEETDRLLQAQVDSALRSK